MQVYLFWQPWLAPIAAPWQIPISKTSVWPGSPSSAQRVPHDPVFGDGGWGQNYLQYHEQDADHQLLVFVQRIDPASEEQSLQMSEAAAYLGQVEGSLWFAVDFGRPIIIKS
jgi:hypothetical protein